VLGFSADGQKMFLYSQYNYYSEPVGNQGISVSRKIGGIWTTPQNEVVPFFQKNRAAPDGHITASKTVFVFSADTGVNGNDIYISFYIGSKWTDAKNLGTNINTMHQELSPWLSSDTKTLYFASNTPSSLGGFDIFHRIGLTVHG